MSATVIDLLAERRKRQRQQELCDSCGYVHDASEQHPQLFAGLDTKMPGEDG